MDLGKNIKELREQRGLKQKEVAEAIKTYPSNYSKIEKGERQLTVEMLVKLADFFNISIEQIIEPSKSLIEDLSSIEDKNTSKQLKMIQQLDEIDKQAVFRIIDTMLANKKLKDFVQQNLAS